MKHPSPHSPINPFTNILILFTFSFLLMTCSNKGTDPGEEAVTFSGKVTLEGQTDQSGVTIALYKPVELDTALVRINQQYPNIGVQISQETEFDHREHTPIVTTVSDVSGNWKIENVAEGEYNVVASKDEFGWIYKTNSNGGTSTNFSLKSVQRISGSINSDFTFEESRQYIVESTVVFQAGATVTFETGSEILVNANAKLQLLKPPVIRKTSKQFTVFKSINPGSYWDRIEIKVPGQVLNIQYLYIIESRRGLDISGVISVTECFIRSSSTNGVNISNSGISSFTNSIISYSMEGLILNSVDSIAIQSCILLKNEIHGISSRMASIYLRNNYLLNAGLGIGVYLQSDNDMDITNTEISNFDVGVQQSHSDITGNENVLRMCRVAIYVSWLSGGNPDAEVLDFHQSNFINISSFLVAVGRSGLVNNGQMQNNYWDTNDIAEISSKIEDVNDNPLSYVEIEFLPFLSVENTTAGLLTNSANIQ